MKCEQARRCWHERIDEELEPATEAALLAHLARCGDCRAWSEQMQAVVSGLEALRRDTEPAGAPLRHATGRRGRWALTGVAAGVALLAAALFWQPASNRPAGLPLGRPPGPPPGKVVGQLPSTVGGGRPRVVLTGESAEEYIAARVETTRTKVHLFRVYRVYEPAAERDPAGRTN